MFKKQVSELQLPPQQLGLLRQAGYDTIDDLIAATPEQLAHDLDIPIEASQSILFATQTQRAPPLTQSAATLLSQNLKQYTTYCQPLDALLNGGITPGSILEISGPPGTAKEALAVNITRSFLEAEHEILFVDMQNMTPAAQLREVLRQYTDLPEDYGTRISHFSIFSLPEFLVFLHQLPSYFPEHPKVGLLVINSLWFPFQASSNLPNWTRNALLLRVQETLTKVGASTGVTVVVTTQLATKLVKDDGTTANFETGSKAILVPQPGNTYLPSGKSFRVIIVPHTRTTGVLRLLTAPMHVRGWNPTINKEESYEMVEGIMQ
ncbi:unnamed protein product [Somion occarium]|uniref:Rad51-like C-terminal domain-containing protein n=1 Tax=Somion occarium TaxID=3059160 RepID=A0ABP1CVL5_9APHY